MKRVFKWTIFSLLALSTSTFGQTLETATPAESAEADEEGLEDEGSPEDWETEGRDDDFSALFDDTHAIGLGFSSLSLPGWSFFYDYNQPKWVFDDKRAQFHYQLSQVGGAQKDTNHVEIATAKQTQFTASVRLMNVGGVFVGAGLGLQEASLKYKPASYEHEASSIFGLLEGGWQGDGGIFFLFGIRPGFHITKFSEIKASIIPEADGHQVAVRRLWRQSQELSGYTLGFGWHIP